MELSEHSVTRLRNYTYTSQDDSYISKALYYICDKIIDYIPKWISPNVITLCGLGIVSFSSIILFFYQSIYSYLFCASCLFAYQLLDVLDGMQGKRTNMYTNPTTEIFDHGCDSITLLLTIFNSIQIFNITTTPMALFFALPICSIFYFSTWEHLHTKVMRFRAGLGNPEESLLITQLLFLLMSVCPDLRTDEIFMSILVAGGFTISLFYLYLIYTKTINHIIDNKSMRYAKHITLLPMILNWSLGLYSWLFVTNPLWLVLTIGVPWVYSVFKLIWAEITDTNPDLASIFFVYLIHFITPNYGIFLTLPMYVFSFCRGVSIVCYYLSMEYFWAIPVQQVKV